MVQAGTGPIAGMPNVGPRIATTTAGMANKLIRQPLMNAEATIKRPAIPTAQPLVPRTFGATVFCAAEEIPCWTVSLSALTSSEPLDAVFPIFNEQTRKPVENPVMRVLREGVIVGFADHTILIARDGTPRPIDDSAAPIRDGTGTIVGVVLIFRDVTEHRRAEQELRASEARKSAILDTALDCIITMDHEGHVVEFNPAAEKTFGYRREQVIGKQLVDFIIPMSLRGRHRNGMAHYLATGEGPVLGKQLHLPALRADGTEFPVELTITRIPTDGHPVFTAYLRDVSEYKRIEQHRNVRIAATHALSEATGAKDGIAEGLHAIQLVWCQTFLHVLGVDLQQKHRRKMMAAAVP